MASEVNSVTGLPPIVQPGATPAVTPFIRFSQSPFSPSAEPVSVRPSRGLCWGFCSWVVDKITALWRRIKSYFFAPGVTTAIPQFTLEQRQSKAKALFEMHFNTKLPEDFPKGSTGFAVATIFEYNGQAWMTHFKISPKEYETEKGFIKKGDQNKGYQQLENALKRHEKYEGELRIISLAIAKDENEMFSCCHLISRTNFEERKAGEIPDRAYKITRDQAVDLLKRTAPCLQTINCNEFFNFVDRLQAVTNPNKTNL